MSDDIEALLRNGLAEKADAMPVFDDPGLADLAIAGAGRIRRRRRVAAAASGAGLLVLAAVVATKPFLLHEDKYEGSIAADTSTEEAQNEFAMEFLIAENGEYSVLNQDGNTVAFQTDEPTGDVYKLTTSYMTETERDVWTVGFDGEATGIEKPSVETYTRVNSVGDRFAMITPNSDYSAESIELVDVSLHEQTEIAMFTTSYALTLEDWDETTAVFTTDLHTVAGGTAQKYWFNDDLDFGLETVSDAGLEAAVLVDQTDPNFVCVSDLDGAGAASVQEQCGPFDSPEVQESLVVAAGEQAEDPNPLVETAIANVTSEYVFSPMAETDLGEFQNRYDQAGWHWTDPKGRWQLAGNPGDDTWLLIDASGDEPIVSELEPPEGALMPVLSYS